MPELYTVPYSWPHHAHSEFSVYCLIIFIIHNAYDFPLSYDKYIKFFELVWLNFEQYKLISI